MSLKIFDSWAGVLDEDGFERWCIRPITIDRGSRARRRRRMRRSSDFRAAPARGSRALLKETGVDAVAVDWMTPMTLARELVPAPMALQGNLDPLRLVVGGKALDDGVDAILSAMRGRAHIFNLGHGITPDTPVAHVEQLVERVRGRRI